MRAAGYIRVSTEEQAQHGYSLDEQDRLIRERAAAKGWQLAEVHRDAGWSGAREDRPGLLELLASLQEIDVVIVWSIDRLARDLVVFAKLVKALNGAGVAIESLTSTVDLGTPEGEAMAGMGAVFAQFERKRIAERVRAAGAARARQGRYSGGARPFGYRFRDTTGGRPTGPLVIHEPEAAIVRRIYALYVAGTAQQAIARTLNAEGVSTARGKSWHQGTVGLILRNSIYAGFVSFGDELHPGEHEPLVELELWQAAEQLRTSSARTKGGRTARGRHLFTRGLLRCSCGGAMIPTTKPTRTGGVYEVYECYDRKRYGREHCPQGPIRRELIDVGTWDYFRSACLDLDATRDAIAANVEQRLTTSGALRLDAERAAHQAHARLDRVRRDYQDGQLDAADWREQREQLASELEAAEAELASLTRAESEIAAHGALVDAEEQLLRQLADLRGAVLGELRDVAGADALRAALARLFESFTVVPVVDDQLQPVGKLPDPATGRLGAVELHDDGYMLMPVIRAEVFAGYRGDSLATAQVRRLPLGLQANTEHLVLPIASVFAPIVLRQNDSGRDSARPLVTSNPRPHEGGDAEG